MELAETILIYASFLVLIPYIAAFFVEKRIKNVIKLHVTQVVLSVLLIAIWYAHIILDFKLGQFSWWGICAISTLLVPLIFNIMCVMDDIADKKKSK